jgi:hypothetical protein
MNSTAPDLADLSQEERALVAELLNSECAKLLVEIRHTERRTYREELKRRLATVERLAARFGPA